MTTRARLRSRLVLALIDVARGHAGRTIALGCRMRGMAGRAFLVLRNDVQRAYEFGVMAGHARGLLRWSLGSCGSIGPVRAMARRTIFVLMRS